MSLFVDPIPLNGISWTLGCFVLLNFGIKSLRTYRQTRNPLAAIYAYLGFVFAVSFGFFGIPPLLTTNTEILTRTYFAADVCAQIGMLGQARLLWFIGLKTRVSWWVVAIPTMCLSATILFLEFHTSTVKIDTAQNLVLYLDSTAVNVLKSLIYAVIAYPIAYFFIRQGIRKSTLKARTNSIAAGLVFLVIATGSIENALVTSGADTRETAIQTILLFGGFQIVSSILSWRQRRTRASQKTAQFPH